MTNIADITIIGGGVIGLLTAREFIKAGATVTVIEKNELGQESSWAGGGILLPIYPWRQPDAITRLVMQSLKLYPTLAAQLASETQIDPEWTQCGLLIVKNPDIGDAVHWCDTNNIVYRPAGADFFNMLNTVPDQPLWLPEIAQARNPRLVKSLKQDLLNKGAILKEHCELTSVNIVKNRITSINTTSGQLAVNQLIAATGAWTGQLFRQIFPAAIGDTPEITPVKGQMLLFDARPETLSYMVLDGDQYLIPRRDGKILAGSTVEQDDFNKTTTTQARDQLGAFALNLLPSLNNCPLIKHWAGLRPGTEHGIPYIDQHPEIDNLYINAGHFRNGLAMGPASAQLMIDLVLKRPTAVAPEPYTLSRPH
ncbi:glycine oxidase ThiO [Candidatus Methylobacter oryzae]|uniref:Glycine oxidase ThiO n=1 Tax=Candidatus Methylobacter oryzae TaxID=2497749 RepID=A0ABY3CA43_9GAMM|nr:glycine oxidase ThiO [Candidatus Methylobacter oryzae]TRW91301.1 glycine oxidase ThiO [Candidatus Methylobacter oryzae]